MATFPFLLKNVLVHSYMPQHVPMSSYYTSKICFYNTLKKQTREGAGLKATEYKNLLLLTREQCTGTLKIPLPKTVVTGKPLSKSKTANPAAKKKNAQ